VWGETFEGGIQFLSNSFWFALWNLCGLTFFGKRFSYSGLQPKQPVGKRFLDLWLLIRNLFDGTVDGLGA
jgi:hypothetical protein